jgi:hypothetical protein
MTSDGQLWQAVRQYMEAKGAVLRAEAVLLTYRDRLNALTLEERAPLFAGVDEHMAAAISGHDAPEDEA